MKIFTSTRRFACVLILYFVLPNLISAATIPLVAWTQTTSTLGTNCGTRVAMDTSGNVYVNGVTDGKAYGWPAGVQKLFVAKYDPNGSLLWSNVSHDSTGQGSLGIAVDGTGNVFASNGYAIKKFNPSGTCMWGVINSGLSGGWYGSIAVDPNGNVYSTGTTYDPNQDTFVSKFDPAGKQLWTKLLHTTNSSYSNSIAVDASGNAVIAGITYDHSYNTTGFATKFDPSGNIVWNEQFTSFAGSVATDPNGSTYLSVGSNLIKYNSANQKQWTKSYVWPDGQASIAIDPNGAEYVGGGSGIVKFDPNGNILEQYTWDNDNIHLAYGNGRLSVDGAKYIPSSNSIDSYVSNIVVPEPSTLALLLTATLGGLLWWRRRR
jgi:hypothetical protein